MGLYADDTDVKISVVLHLSHAGLKIQISFNAFCVGFNIALSALSTFFFFDFIIVSSLILLECFELCDNIDWCDESLTLLSSKCEGCVVCDFLCPSSDDPCGEAGEAFFDTLCSGFTGGRSPFVGLK